MINFPIVRLFASVEQARSAVSALKRWGFEDELINVVTAASTPPSGAPASAASDDPVLSAIMSAYVLKADAKIYAQEVRSGRTLVSVTAPFGTGGYAEELLDDCSPVKSAVVSREDSLPLWDESAPFSSALNLPTVIRAVAPFSAFWVLPTTTRKGGTLCSALGLPEVSRSDSYMFGAPAVSNAPSPLSSMLGLPTLMR